MQPLRRRSTSSRNARRRTARRSETTTVDGVPTKRIQVCAVSIYYAVVDGKLVITDASAGSAASSGGGRKLADDPVFKDATSAAGMPDETDGLRLREHQGHGAAARASRRSAAGASRRT